LLITKDALEKGKRRGDPVVEVAADKRREEIVACSPAPRLPRGSRRRRAPDQGGGVM